jgi:hydroxymethylbilane synthase
MIIGSRGSALALWQARFIASQLDRIGIATRIEIIKTTGDHLQTASLSEKPPKGLFTKEIEEALLADTIDLAVHSLKDLPTETPAGLVLAAIPEREDPHDALVGSPLADLTQDARVGTSSDRRASQLRILRPDLEIQPIRGNVDTRLRKLKEGQFDAIVLAAAGLRRLGLEQEIRELLTAEQMCPAPGQGALAIETRESGPARDICAQLDHTATRQAVVCERAVLAGLGGGCRLPLGAYAEFKEGVLQVMAIVISPDGSRHLRAQTGGAGENAVALGKSVAADLLARGAAGILTGNGA